MALLDDKKHWYAVRTRNRSEKWVVQQLHDKDVEAWIPLKWSIKKYPGRVRKTQIPLIYGYVFVFIDQREYVQVLEAEGVFEFVRFNQQIPTIPSDQIELLKYITGENQTLKVQMTDSVMERGDQVEIIGGELTGLSGELIEFKGKHRVLMRMENVGLSFFIEVPKEKLRKKS